MVVFEKDRIFLLKKEDNSVTEIPDFLNDEDKHKLLIDILNNNDINLEINQNKIRLYNSSEEINFTRQDSSFGESLCLGVLDVYEMLKRKGKKLWF